MSSSGQLRSYLNNRVVESMDCERVKREAWRNSGDLVLMHDQLNELTQTERRAIEQIATRIYGVKIIKENFK